MEYLVGQILEGKTEYTAFVNWTAVHPDCKLTAKPVGMYRYEVCDIPLPPPPTREDIERARIGYRREHIDDKTLSRMRKQANGTWTQEMEDAYLALDAEVTAYIEEHLPYPVEE